MLRITGLVHFQAKFMVLWAYLSPTQLNAACQSSYLCCLVIVHRSAEALTDLTLMQFSLSATMQSLWDWDHSEISQSVQASMYPSSASVWDAKMKTPTWVCIRKQANGWTSQAAAELHGIARFSKMLHKISALSQQRKTFNIYAKKSLVIIFSHILWI